MTLCAAGGGCQKAASDSRSRCRRFGAAPETEYEHGLTRQLRHQSDVPRSGIFIFPGHRVVTGGVLPAVAIADIADTRSPDGIALLFATATKAAEGPSLGP